LSRLWRDGGHSGARGARPREVDQHVDRTEVTRDAIHQVDHRRAIRDVAFDRERAPAAAIDRRHHLTGCVGP
jgi:hypothetical protein